MTEFFDLAIIDNLAKKWTLQTQKNYDVKHQEDGIGRVASLCYFVAYIYSFHMGYAPSC